MMSEFQDQASEKTEYPLPLLISAGNEDTQLSWEIFTPLL